MKQVDEDFSIMIDTRSDEIAEIMFFQEKQYGQIDEAMVDMEVLMLIQDVWERHKVIKTGAQIRQTVFAKLEGKNRKFVLSAQN